MTDLGHWVYSGEFNTDAYGFIYKITNTATNRAYIGKKQMKSVKKKPPLKGRKNKRHTTVETDWRTYTGSCNELNEDIKNKVSDDQFKFEIVKLCGSKSELAYYEAKAQFDADVLLTDSYYNGIINCRIGRIKV